MSARNIKGRCWWRGKPPIALPWRTGATSTGTTSSTGSGPGGITPGSPGYAMSGYRPKSPTYGDVTVVIVDGPGQDRFYLLCLETTLSGPQLIGRWRRRHWIEFVFRVLKHLLATESGQVHSEDAYYGHLVLRLMASFVLFYTSRVICKGRLTMEEIIFSLKHYWRFVDMEPLELQAFS